MKSLFWRIYLTIIFCLLAFGVATFWLAEQRVDRAEARLARWEQSQLQILREAAQERLPAADAPRAEQAHALQQLSREIRRPLALDDAQGNRVAESRSYRRGLKLPLRQAPHAGKANPRSKPPIETVNGSDFMGEHGGLDVLGKQKHRSIETRLPDGRVLSTLHPPVPKIQAEWMERLTASLGSLMLLLLAAIALVAYPLVRRMSKRFTSLQYSMQAFGDGQLDTRAGIYGTDEAAHMAHSFNGMADRIQQLIGSHRQLLATASHELRSPLTRLQMAASLFVTAAPPQRSELQIEIEQNIHELNDLIEEILLSSKLDAQTEQPTLVQADIAPLLVRLAQHYPRVELTGADAPQQALVHEKLFVRAVRNLLENALRYSEETVTLDLGRQGAFCTVTVTDTGDGIPQEQRDNVFKPFFRLPRHAEHQGGTGLGLALVRQVAQAHNGDIYYEANVPQGSRFVLSVRAV